MRLAGILLVAAFATAGCTFVEKLSHAPVLPRNREPPLPGPPTYSQYHLESWRWEDVNRVLVLPPWNESTFTRAGDEFQANLSSELQRLGRFEVVAVPQDPEFSLAKLIHTSGRFDEGALLDLAKATRADVIVFPTITQYSPYPRPRMGLSLQAVSAVQGKVIASVDGLWDTTDASIAEDVRTFYRQRAKQLPARVRNFEIATDDSFASERALDSPQLFQRYIANISSRMLIGLKSSGGVPMQTDRPISLPRWRPKGFLPNRGDASCVGCQPGAEMIATGAGGATGTPAGGAPVVMPPNSETPKALPLPRPQPPENLPPAKSGA